MDLDNRTAVVTGASAGPGAAICRDLVRHGATVIGLARRTDRLDALGAELGDTFTGIACDVRDESSVESAFGAIRQAGHIVDILVNNAGLGQFGEVDGLSTDAYDVQMDTNVRGVFLCTRAVLPGMKARNRETGFGGHIVNIGSVAGLLGNPRISIYNATKFALRGFSEALMKEVRDDGIKVTCIYPGSIATEFQDVAETSGVPNPMTSEDVASTVTHVLATPANYLISEVMMRPLRPRG